MCYVWSGSLMNAIWFHRINEFFHWNPPDAKQNYTKMLKFKCDYVAFVPRYSVTLAKQMTCWVFNEHCSSTISHRSYIIHAQLSFFFLIHIYVLIISIYRRVSSYCGQALKFKSIFWCDWWFWYNSNF